MITHKDIKKLKTIDDCDEELKKLEEERLKWIIKREPIDRKITEAWNKLKAVNEKKTAMEVKKNTRSGQIKDPKKLDWHWLLEEKDERGMTERYNLRRDMVHKLGLYSGGYFQDTNQACVKVMLTRDDDETYKQTVDSLKFLLPFYKPREDGYIYIDIFEHTLSEGGIYWLLIKPNMKEFKITFTRYSHTEDYEKFKTLEDAIKYIQKNLWYQKTEDDY